MTPVFCEYCGVPHDPTRLCHRVLGRRAFLSLTGLGLLALNLGPHLFDALAPMIGPRLESLAADGTILASTRLQEGVWQYLAIHHPGIPLHVEYAAVRGTAFDFVSPIRANVESSGTLSYTLETYHRTTVYFPGCALSMPGGLFNTIPEIKQRMLNGECQALPFKMESFT